MPAETSINDCLFLPGASCYEFWQIFATPLTKIVVVTITIIIAFKKLSTQHSNNLKAKKEEYKSQTRIELFKEISVISDHSSSAIRDVSTYCMVKKYSNQVVKKEINHVEYHNILQKFGDALLALISKVESHEIVNLKLFRAFRFSLQSIQHDLMALRSTPDRAIILENILELAEDAQMYIGDFQVCMQNMAYGEIFESSVPDRVPADKRIKVITIDEKNLDSLIAYFCSETNWGKTCAKYQADAEERFSN